MPPWLPPPPRRPSPWELVQTGFWLGIGIMVSFVVVPAIVIIAALVLFALVGRNPYI
jgi:hypothetical protein